MKRNYKEIAKKNIFIARAAEIRDICLKEDVDIGVGLDMYISNHGIQKTEKIMKQYQEFRKYCREDTLKSIVEALGNSGRAYTDCVVCPACSFERYCTCDFWQTAK